MGGLVTGPEAAWPPPVTDVEKVDREADCARRRDLRAAVWLARMAACHGHPCAWVVAVGPCEVAGYGPCPRGGRTGPRRSRVTVQTLEKLDGWRIEKSSYIRTCSADVATTERSTQETYIRYLGPVAAPVNALFTPRNTLFTPFFSISQSARTRIPSVARPHPLLRWP